jgi:hypothetical protein
MLYNLNRINFLSNHSNIPKSIIKSLVYTCGASVTDEQVENKEKEIIKFIKEYKNEVNEDFEKIEDNDGLLKIATFVGDKKSWKSKEKLIDALKHIITFSTVVDIKNSLKNNRVKIGYKNNDDIYKCDPIMAYIYCCNERITLEKNDTISDIENKINDYLQTELELSKIQVVVEEKKIEEEKDLKIKRLEDNLQKIKEEKDQMVRSLERLKEEKDDNLQKIKQEKDEKVRSLERLKEEKEEMVRKLERLKEEKDENFRKLERLKEESRGNDEEKIRSKEVNDEKIRRLERLKEETDEKVRKLERLKEESDEKVRSEEGNQKVLKLADKEINLPNLKLYLKKPPLNFIVSKVFVNNEEAVYIGLKYLQFDLRNSPEPYKDLLELNQTIIDKKVFLPDRKDTFSQNLKLNKNYYSLRHYYIKDLKDFYTPKILSELYEEYNIKDKKLETLENYFEKDNFYRGWLYDEYSYFEKKNFKLSHQKDILSFGKYNTSEGKLVSFEIDELIKLFKSKGNLDPILEGKLLPEQIDFIKSLCKRFGEDKKYQELSLSLEGKKLEDNEYIKNFIEKYLYSSYLIGKVLDDIMRIGFFIRGWRIKDNMTYPLYKKDCVDQEIHKNSIEENVKRVLTEFKHHLESIKDPNIRHIILNLPLVNYIARDFVYDKEDKKLEDLIFMIEKYDQNDIKEISNKTLLFSYYYYYVSSDKKYFTVENLELF